MTTIEKMTFSAPLDLGGGYVEDGQFFVARNPASLIEEGGWMHAVQCAARIKSGDKYADIPKEGLQFASREAPEAILTIQPKEISGRVGDEKAMKKAVSEVRKIFTQLLALPDDSRDVMILEIVSCLMLQKEAQISGKIVFPSRADPNANPGVPANPGTGTGTGTGGQVTGFHPLPDLITERSGPLARDSYGHPTPVTLQRTTRTLTGDVALWLLIKLNADMLSWDNYINQMDRLFFPGDFTDGMAGTAAPMYAAAAQLSRRRFLPFTDTDAYRALKVATEAFIVTWGAVVPKPLDAALLSELLSADSAAIALANDRLGLRLNQLAVEGLVAKYFGDASVPPSLPYLQRVAIAMQGTDAAGVIQGMLEDEAGKVGDDVPDPNGACGNNCLWLRHWNRNISAKLAQPPLIELIWSYWMEELQLVQTMNAISRRFQNISVGQHDPLAQLELDPLRPLNNMIWGWVQDEQHRLPIERRAAEYMHEYGFRLIGKAVPQMQPADTRSKFLAAFHTLLNLCVPFFRQADDTTVVPDGFPLLNALREVHLILSEGAHNQFRDLPTTARVEMMMQQWMLARTEFREFLPRRSMIAYPEPWMHSVESMRKLQGWGDTNTYQFWQLATTGEQIVSSIRWSDWNSVNDPSNAANWAAFFRPEIQTYIHSYRAVTGIDVGAEPVDVQVPGMHLLRRLREQKGIKVA